MDARRGRHLMVVTDEDRKSLQACFGNQEAGEDNDHRLNKCYDDDDDDNKNIVLAVISLDLVHNVITPC